VLDEGGPVLNEGITGMPGKATKAQKPGSLCTGEALSNLQRGKRGVGEAEVRCLPGDDALHGDMRSFRQLLGRERGMQREFPLGDTMTCFPPPITPLMLLLAPERPSRDKAELGERDVRMLVLLMRRSVAQFHPAWPESFFVATCSL